MIGFQRYCKWTAIVGVFCCIVNQAKSYEDLVYKALYLETPLIIDGIAEQAWNDIAPTWLIAQDGDRLEQSSWFKITWDENYLYYLAYLEDKNIEAQMRRRDDPLWYEDVIELFIDADDNPKTYYEFEWNALNNVLDLVVLNRNYDRSRIKQWWNWDCIGMQSAVVVDGTVADGSDVDKGWMLEVAIPFSEIYSAKNIPPIVGDRWRFNVTRRDGNEANGSLQKSSWRPPATHFPLSYGSMVFEK